MQEKKIPLAVIVGPTASGKTKLAVDLAKAFHGEVISADSMQIYRYMTIGTAKPTPEEMDGVPHHLIDFLEPDQPFSVAQYVELARQTIEEVDSRGHLPIVAGGTGLYIDSLIYHIDFTHIENDPALRSRLQEEANTLGGEAMLERLRQVDPILAPKLHANNLGRIIRALEVYYLTGKPMSWHQQQSRLRPSPYETKILGLTYRDRQKLYDRIDLRVEKMVENGLLEEAKVLFASKFSNTATQAIGYKELTGYFSGEKSLEECVTQIQQQSRRYAKRQLTWFRRNPEIHWLEVDACKNYEELLDLAKSYMKF